MDFDHRWLCQNSHAIISPLIFMTDFIDIYSLLPENVSFLECFRRSHSYFIRYYNNPVEITDNPTEITRNYFCGVFLKNHKYFQEMFLRRLRDVTEKTYFLRCFSDVLKTSRKSHLFWDVHNRPLRCCSQWRSDWDLSKTSHGGWVKTIRQYFLS